MAQETTKASPATSDSDRNAKRASRSRTIRKWLFAAFMIAAAVLWLIPIIWMFSLSLTPNVVLHHTTTHLFPIDPTVDNFAGVFKIGLTPRWFLNSLIVTISTTVFTLVLSAMGGYAFARIPFRGKRFAFPLVLLGLMVPREAMFVPLFLMFAELDLHNTYIALVIPRIAAPLGVFIMAQFFTAIPDSLEEAARVDGAGRWSIFLRIMVPMAGPALTALAIFTFVTTWNSFLWPLVSATKREMFTITTGLASLQSHFSQATEFGSLMARGVLASLPLLVLFILFERQLVRGISIGSGNK